jgi:hypothetical protein
MQQPRSASFFRALSLAWLISLAFECNRACAILTYPIHLISTLASVFRRGIYESGDRNGVVVILKKNFFSEIVATLLAYILAMVAVVAVALLAFLIWMPLGFLVLSVAGLWLVAGALVTVCHSRTFSSVGKETPRGKGRWGVSSLAQRPGTSFSAVQLAMRIIPKVVPEGHVLVAAAADTKLQKKYVKSFQFVAGEKLRVHKTL